MICGPGEFPTQRPVTRSFDVYFDLRPNKRLSKQSWGWWFETQSCPLWRHRNDYFATVHTTYDWMCMLMHGGGIGLCDWGRDLPVAVRGLIAWISFWPVYTFIYGVFKSNWLKKTKWVSWYSLYIIMYCMSRILFVYALLWSFVCQNGFVKMEQ